MFSIQNFCEHACNTAQNNVSWDWRQAPPRAMGRVGGHHRAITREQQCAASLPSSLGSVWIIYDHSHPKLTLVLQPVGIFTTTPKSTGKNLHQPSQRQKILGVYLSYNQHWILWEKLSHHLPYNHDLAQKGSPREPVSLPLSFCSHSFCYAFLSNILTLTVRTDIHVYSNIWI